jgi:hypothetical protein
MTDNEVKKTCKDCITFRPCAKKGDYLSFETTCGNFVDKAIIEENKLLKRVVENQRQEIAILREKLSICREHYSREDKFI